MLSKSVRPSALEELNLRRDLRVGLLLGDVRDGRRGDVVPARLVKSEHRPGSRRRTLLDVAEDLEPRSADVGASVEEEGGDILGETVEVKNNGLVLGEETSEGDGLQERGLSSCQHWSVLRGMVKQESD